VRTPKHKAVRRQPTNKPSTLLIRAAFVVAMAPWRMAKRGWMGEGNGKAKPHSRLNTELDEVNSLEDSRILLRLVCLSLGGPIIPHVIPAAFNI